jgi:hypothetical protein
VGFRETAHPAAGPEVSAAGTPGVRRPRLARLPPSCRLPASRRRIRHVELYEQPNLRRSVRQPLYHPSDDLTSTYGFRLGNDFWDVDEANPDAAFSAIAEEVRREALPFFEQVTDLDRFCALVPQWATEEPKKIMRNNSLDDPVVLEDLAYAAVLRGNRDRAVELLEAAVVSEQECGEYVDDELLADLEYTLGLIQRRGLESRAGTARGVGQRQHPKPEARVVTADAAGRETQPRSGSR